MNSNRTFHSDRGKKPPRQVNLTLDLKEVANMKDKRYREIMEQIGWPNSRSLLGALQQVSNETAQEIKGVSDSKVLSIIDSCFHTYASSCRAEAAEMAKRLLR